MSTPWIEGENDARMIEERARSVMGMSGPLYSVHLKSGTRRDCVTERR